MINEKKLIEQLKQYNSKNIVAIGIIDIISILNEQPKVGEWIPVSERLPEKDGWYLETVVCGVVKRTGFGLLKNGIWEHFEDGIETIAWQPLPEPYRKDVE